MTTPNLTVAFAAIEKLTLRELRDFVPLFNAHIKQKSRMANMVKAATKVNENAGVFVAGNILKWVSTKRETRGQMLYMKMTGFNRARTCAVGMQCDEKGKVFPDSDKWTVGIGLLKQHIPNNP